MCIRDSGDPSAIYTSSGRADRKMLRTRSKCTISGIGFGSKYLANLKYPARSVVKSYCLSLFELSHMDTHRSLLADQLLTCAVH